MKTKIRVGAVSYLNTKPLIYGFEKGMMQDEVELVMDYPSRIAMMLLNDEIDVGLVPVSVLPELQQHYLMADYCIGCDGEVGSVALFSDVPLIKIKKIILDFQSRTSVELLKILINEYWQIDPVLEMATGDYQQQITATTAGLVIGDRAFQQRKISAYSFDLGLEWKKFTGLPFVFAAWVSNKKMPLSFTRAFNEATGEGLRHIEEIVRDNPSPLFDLTTYYTSFIKYKLNTASKKMMYGFLEKSSKKRFASPLYY